MSRPTPTMYQTTNWPAYNEALKRRGSLTIWFDPEMTTGLNGKVMTYDGGNRPLSVTANGQRTCYVYGVDGACLKKVEGLAANQNCATLPANAGATVYFGDVEIRNWGVARQETVTTCPDVDSHLEGAWKMFDRSGRRLGTYSADLKTRIGN